MSKQLMIERIADGKCPICAAQVRHNGHRLSDSNLQPSKEELLDGEYVSVCQKHPTPELEIHRE